MKIINPNIIIETLKLLNDCNINYALLRNIDDEIPYHLRANKDIDIWVDINFLNISIAQITKEHFIKVKHPLANDKFLYSMRRPIYLKHKYTDLYLDITPHIFVRTIDDKYFCPLEMNFQNYIAKNIIVERSGEVNYNKIDINSEFILLVCRCIFDKKFFPEPYINQIEKIIHHIDEAIVLKYFGMIFFRAAHLILNEVKDKKYLTLRDKLIKFRNY